MLKKKKNKRNVHYIKVQLMINFQNPAFQDLTNFCNNHLYTKPLSQFRAVRSYGTRNTRTGKQNCLKLLYTKVLSLYWSVSHIPLWLSFGHMLTFIPHKRYILCLCFSIVLVITRISLNRGLLYRGSVPCICNFG